MRGYADPVVDSAIGGLAAGSAMAVYSTFLFCYLFCTYLDR
jgi:hypothetical protein